MEAGGAPDANSCGAGSAAPRGWGGRAGAGGVGVVCRGAASTEPRDGRPAAAAQQRLVQHNAPGRPAGRDPPPPPPRGPAAPPPQSHGMLWLPRNKGHVNKRRGFVTKARRRAVTMVKGEFMVT